jgi:SAM-dependent methyltransferase
LRTALNSLAQRIPVTTKRSIIRYTRWPPVGWARLGSLRRTKPISPSWGTERGQPVDRYYIEGFLAANAGDIRGRVLEIGDNSYTRAFGKDRVTRSDVLHVVEDRPQVTIIGDLTNADHIPAETFDCIILTQTLQAIFDVAAAIRTVHRILKPDGVLLATIPGISQISRYDMDRWGYYWSFTSRSAEELFAAAFPRDRVQVETHGNVLAAVAFLHGLASTELRRAELDYRDPDYQLLITVRAVRFGGERSLEGSP